MHLPITTISAILLALLLIVLSVRVILLRRSGEAQPTETLQRAIRGHGNLTEYAPLFLILLGLAEAEKSQTWILIGISGIFIVGRYIHGILFAFLPKNPILRVVGMACTFTGLIGLLVINSLNILL